GLTLLLMPRRSLQLFAAVSLVSAALLFVEPEPMLAFIRRGGTCFFAGVLLYRLYERIREAVMRLDDGPLFDALELLGVLLVYRVLTAELPHKGLLASLLFCAVILVFAFERGVISRLLRMRLFKRLGELSFSIYLTHAAVLFVFTSVAIVLSRLLGAEFTVILENPQSHQIMRYITSGDRLIDVLLTVALLGAVLMVSTFTYHCIELKGMALGRRLSQSQPRYLSRV
ncbi:MAG TPA: acyltransferase, partial [Pseudomonas sp.]|nr:acyltransferase [Pseudomonas sp.]